MAYIIEQTSYNSEIFFGNSEKEAVCQSVIMGSSFITNFVTVRINSWTLDPVRTPKFRIEIREAYNEEKLLDFSSEPVLSSNWKFDHEILPNSFNQFEFDRETILPKGVYFLCLVSDIRILYPLGVSFYFEEDSYFLGKFIKIEKGTGLYSQDRSLTFRIDGLWTEEESLEIRTIESNVFTTTIITS